MRMSLTMEQANNDPNVSKEPAPPTPGGGLLALDMSNERDRGAVRTAMRDWPKRFARMNAEKQDEIVDGLMEANRIARAHLTDPDKSMEAVKAVASIASTAKGIVAIQQKDDHARAGVADPVPNQIVVIQSPPRQRIE